MKNIWIFCFSALFLCTCHKNPDFGIQIIPTKKECLFYKLPNDYSVKHIVHVSFNHPLAKNKGFDFIGYLMVKGKNFRLVGINEVGITLFDIFQENNKPLVVVKSFPELEEFNILENMAIDINLCFLSQYALEDKNIKVYKKDDITNCVLVEDSKWTSWEKKEGRVRQIAQETLHNYLRKITFSEKMYSFFPKAIYIKYPNTNNVEMSIEIEILEFQDHIVTDDKFFPKSKP